MKVALAIVVLVVLDLPLVPNALAQEAEPVVLFRDDFEDASAGRWRTDDGWGIALDGGKHVLEAKGSDRWTWAEPLSASEWGAVSSVEIRIKRARGNAQVNFRFVSWERRYVLTVRENGLALLKAVPPDTGSRPTSYVQAGSLATNIDSFWHTLRITADGDTIKVFFDGSMAIEYQDQRNPYLNGSVVLEVAPDSLFYFDDVVVKGQPAPEGYIWTRLGGPRGGIGYDVKIDPRDADTIYVSDSNAGVHKSTDGGMTWRPMNAGITARAGPAGDSIPIFSLTVDPRNPDTIWVGTQGMRGVYKSADGARTWAKMDKGIEDQPVMEIRSFTVDPRDSDIVYLGGNYSPDPQKQLVVRGFIYKTTDGGKSWTKILDAAALVRWIIVDPTKTNVIYASTGLFDRLAVRPEGVLKSTDGGRTWRNINNGMSNYAAVSGLVMHPNDPQVLYAFTGKWPPFHDSPDDLRGAIYKTTDSGENWRKLLETSSAITTGYVNPALPDTVYATPHIDFLRSTDAGENWTRSRGGPPNDSPGGPVAIAVHPDKPHDIFIDAYAGGVFKSADRGATWQDASKGYSGAVVYDIVLPRSDDPAYVMAATHNGIYTSKDGGSSWEAHNNPRAGSTPFSIAVNPTNPNEVLLGDRINWAIRKSTDGGEKFYDVLGPFQIGRLEDERMANEIAYAPSNPRIIYAVFSVGPHEKGDPSNPGPGVYKSVDGGRTWAQVNSGLEQTTLNVLAVAVHPNNPDIVFVGTQFGGIYRSTNGGRSWQESNAGITVRAISAIAMVPSDPTTLYAGADGGGVFKSVDSGATWRPVLRGIPFEASISSIVVDPSNAQRVFAADLHSGDYLSLEGGETWQKINAGLFNRAVTALAISRDGRVLYAATSGGGVFRLGKPQIQVWMPTATLEPTPAPVPRAVPPAVAPTATATLETGSSAVPPDVAPTATATMAKPARSSAPSPPVITSPAATLAPAGPARADGASPTSKATGGIRDILLYAAAAGMAFAIVAWCCWRWRSHRSGRRET
ncbi:MAG: hypothetical protein HYY32_01080 [Chloroflexi bacterium]|nr:hypothetical protein [Chloroflexota bacterium]